ncbi:hypothetical protein C6401_14065 [Arthrobacter woluwensis]|uniref:VOC family protein n=1 Tax=Arthrobacter woluwensis TaxID=156980 RepID=UPI000D13B2BC|nr:VOC family protein [Arthrobacter woluwensis]PSS43164.1 hypothetical protein C6401_14065 [Arthrobacter woluwensis]
MTTIEAVREGDIVYVSMMLPDEQAAADFYASVFGWTFERTEGEHSEVEIAGANIQHAINQAGGPPNLFICFAVDDVAATSAKVGPAGGNLEGTPYEEDGGLTVGVTDSTGRSTTLYQFLKAPTPRATRSSAKHGDVIGILVESNNPQGFTEFYQNIFAVDSTWDAGELQGSEPLLRVIQAERNRARPVYGVRSLTELETAVTAAGGTIEEDASWSAGGRRYIDPQGFFFYAEEL